MRCSGPSLLGYVLLAMSFFPECFGGGTTLLLVCVTCFWLSWAVTDTAEYFRAAYYGYMCYIVG